MHVRKRRRETLLQPLRSNVGQRPAEIVKQRPAKKAYFVLRFARGEAVSARRDATSTTVTGSSSNSLDPNTHLASTAHIGSSCRQTQIFCPSAVLYLLGRDADARPMEPAVATIAVQHQARAQVSARCAPTHATDVFALHRRTRVEYGSGATESQQHVQSTSETCNLIFRYRLFWRNQGRPCLQGRCKKMKRLSFGMLRPK